MDIQGLLTTRSNTSPTSDTSQTPSSCFLETWKSHLKSTFCTRSSLYKQLDGRLICLCFCKGMRFEQDLLPPTMQATNSPRLHVDSCKICFGRNEL
ncbi:hypothetical protein M404DRAFT_601544 [Pisolithus tinctorius Marx 270]|uniref:Uncharacterized protein n=1 Tax=Pisolithus tinctorius Marx 270 TaxID=870435 RepID=A0A0C3NT52_PISTI|nr:hypothetical protein M404DRAFT_601544 [Pisolithus tinctorius Marx 270]